MTGPRSPEPDRDELEAIHERIASRLADDGQRYTRGRRTLVGTLAGASGPVTIPELSAMAPSLPASTMYRNLEILERSGLVRRITASGDHARWEMCEPLVAHHHHLICDRCGTIEDITLDDETEHLVERTLADVAARSGFVPADHILDLHGTCARCR